MFLFYDSRIQLSVLQFLVFHFLNFHFLNFHFFNFLCNDCLFYHLVFLLPFFYFSCYHRRQWTEFDTKNMILGCFGLTGLLIFNISFIFKSIGITNYFEKKDEIHDNLKIFESFIKREILKLKLLKLLKMNIFSNLGKIFSNRKQNFFFKILWKLLKKIVKKSEDFLEAVLHHFYFFVIIIMVLFHGISTFSNSYVIEVRNIVILFLNCITSFFPFFPFFFSLLILFIFFCYSYSELN